MGVASERYDIVPSHLIVKALRDSGYKNAAYAIAELVDNAVQANASDVEILCIEELSTSGQRSRERVTNIAVVDNGCGMDAETLRKALQFGNGSRLDDRSGIGRFGMGLPNSSMSQARRVDVWSWQNGHSNALYTYLDLKEIESGHVTEVPSPHPKAVPQDWLRYSNTIRDSKSGTLVLWSNLDRCDWKTAKAIFKNSELTIGRIYRRFLEAEIVKIRMAAFSPGQIPPKIDDLAKPNDPIYLMSNTSCPEPWEKVPMFEQFGDLFQIPVEINNERHRVTIRFSIAQRVAREGYNPGELPHGKHARGNIGVSVVRADRELELQIGWCNQYDPRERWWGVEVDFPPALDETFGVTNNKQSARLLAEFATISAEQIAEREGYSSVPEMRESWVADGDTRIVLLDVKQVIESNLSTIRATIKQQSEGKKGNKRHLQPDSAEVIGTKATEVRKREGHSGASDRDEGLPANERQRIIAQDLEDQGLAAEEAEEKANVLVGDGRKYEFYKANLESSEFFTVRRKGGALLIGLNVNHPAYNKLVTILEHGDESGDVDTLKGRLHRSYEGLKLLLEAWARYEDEQTDGLPRERVQDARRDWGRMARLFFRED